MHASSLAPSIIRRQQRRDLSSIAAVTCSSGLLAPADSDGGGKDGDGGAHAEAQAQAQGEAVPTAAAARAASIHTGAHERHRDVELHG